MGEAREHDGRVALEDRVAEAFGCGDINFESAEFSRTFRAGERGRNVVSQLDPGMGCVKDLWRSVQAMQNFAPEPFAGIGASAFGEELRANLFRPA